YGALFFDVAESLAATDWTTYSAIGLGRIRPAAVSEGDIWRFTAFFGGEHPLDLIIADHRGRTEPAVADRHLLAEQGRWVAREGFWVAATWRVDRVHLDEGRRLFAGVVKRDPMLATQVGFLRRVVCAPQRDQSLTATKAAHSKSKGSRAKPRRPSAPSETAAKPPARSEPHDQTDALKPREVGPIEGPAYGKADPEECRPAA
ncbi:MAG TPA: hypothetical protein VMS17_32375, partial [Gemmataceae bacterium]|nr:hypothetical protein [Gemmataceae bacterium]